MTTTHRPTINGTPTGELPLVPSPSPRAAVEAAAADRPDDMFERIKRGQAERAAAIVEQYCSTYTTPRHRLGERRNEVHSVLLAPVGAPREEPRSGIPSLLVKLLGAHS